MSPFQRLALFAATNSTVVDTAKLIINSSAAVFNKMARVTTEALNEVQKTYYSGGKSSSSSTSPDDSNDIAYVMAGIAGFIALVCICRCCGGYRCGPGLRPG